MQCCRYGKGIEVQTGLQESGKPVAEPLRLDSLAFACSRNGAHDLNGAASSSDGMVVSGRLFPPSLRPMVL